MIPKALKRNNVIHRFLEAGAVDSKTFRYPDFDKILATCRLYSTEDEYKLWNTYIPYLYSLYHKDGRVTDNLFEELWFPIDWYLDGITVRCEITVTQEARQRIQSFTYPHMLELHMYIILTVISKETHKEADKIDTV